VVEDAAEEDCAAGVELEGEAVSVVDAGGEESFAAGDAFEPQGRVGARIRKRIHNPQPIFIKELGVVGR